MTYQQLGQRSIQIAFCLSLILWGFAQNLIAQDYDHEIKLKTMSFAWSIAGENLNVKLSAKTKSWVGIGFNPTDKMKGANYILGYVKRGKAKFQDGFGVRPLEHIKDELVNGTKNISNESGTEENGVTTVQFTIPLDTGEKADGKIETGKMITVLLAYGNKRDNFTSKHKYRTTLRVNLSTGEYK